MTIRSTIVAALSGLALVATACAAGGGEATLEGTNWRLTSIDGQSPVAGSTITALFDTSGNVGGSSGCNSYGASYTVSGTGLTIGQTVGTLMACEEPLMQQESDYLAALSATASYAIAPSIPEGISGDTLTIKDSSGASRLVFAAQSNELGGTSWIVTGYNNGRGGVVSVLLGTELTADFGADGQLTGNAGCNSYNAAYSTTGDSITIGAAASTRMFCGEPEGVMDQEAQYLAALSTASTFVISGNGLELRTSDGALAASFAKAGS
jgi:heat shock protein HslJ